MGLNFNASLSKSMQVYERCIKPTLIPILRGELITVEGHTDDETADMLDKLAGIDIFQKTERGLAGIASRIQFDGINHRTFTVRYARASGVKTEYEKRVLAVRNQLLYPKYTFQAYTDKDGTKLLGLGVIRTTDLLDYIKKHKPRIRVTGSDQIGQAAFFFCEWSDIKKKGYEMWESAGDDDPFMRGVTVCQGSKN